MMKCHWWTGHGVSDWAGLNQGRIIKKIGWLGGSPSLHANVDISLLPGQPAAL